MGLISGFSFGLVFFDFWYEVLVSGMVFGGRPEKSILEPIDSLEAEIFSPHFEGVSREGPTGVREEIGAPSLGRDALKEDRGLQGTQACSKF